jgi:small subunit ribosomal protein S3
LEAATGKRVRVDIHEIRQPELEAPLIAQSIADQIERHISFRRAAKQAVSRSMQAGAQGVRVLIAGRLGGAEIARREKAMAGRVPLHTLRADIDFGQAEARTQMGQIGIKVWVYRGDIISELTTAEEARRRGLLGGIEPTKTAVDDSQEAGQPAAVVVSDAAAAETAEASAPTLTTDTEQQDQDALAIDETDAEDD